MFRNTAIEHELALRPDSWEYIRPQSFIENYRNQTTVEQRERYPNVDWQKALFKDNTMSYNANINISGGTKFVKYFASADYVHEGDLLEFMITGVGITLVMDMTVLMCAVIWISILQKLLC